MKNDCTQVKVTETYAEFNHNSGKIFNFDARRFVLNKLTSKEWIAWARRYQIKSRFYSLDGPGGKLRVPVAFGKDIVDACGGIQHFNIEDVTDTFVDLPSCNIGMDPNFPDKSEVQTKAIDYVVTQNPFNKITLKLQTGAGKTFCAIKSSVLMNKRTLIVSKPSLINMWRDAICKFTMAEEEDILKLQGKKVIDKINDETYLKGYSYIIVSPRILHRIFNNKYPSFPSMEEFLSKMGIGLKIIDECHLEFETITKLELNNRIPKHIYLSGTPGRSCPQENRIFKRMLPEEILYDGGYKRYCHIYVYSYQLSSLPRQKDYQTPKGYSSAKYEQWILKQPSILSQYLQVFLLDIFEQHFLNIREPDHKLLILASTIEMVHEIVQFINSRHSYLQVNTKVTGDPESNLEGDVDVIVSTPMSCGTGTDISKLRSVINTCSVGSENLILQMLGRLRELEGHIPEYVDVWNLEIDKHALHASTRMEIYMEKGAKFEQLRA